MRFKARLLPDELPVRMLDKEVPLIVEHRIFSRAIGKVILDDDDQHFGIIESEDPRVKKGTKLSSGVFLMEDNIHEIREVSITKRPVYPVCEVLEELP